MVFEYPFAPNSHEGSSGGLPNDQLAQKSLGLKTGHSMCPRTAIPVLPRPQGGGNLVITIICSQRKLYPDLLRALTNQSRDDPTGFSQCPELDPRLPSVRPSGRRQITGQEAMGMNSLSCEGSPISLSRSQ
ncbi:hypothetical protein BaRGS_00014115 [Batillaria attramentaria]|uniref:Uncharacterized protein n=1 Tax=Batillaria attramentaria TaxID=370345 RepID=A0ABD0L5L1_9CAEN